MMLDGSDRMSDYEAPALQVLGSMQSLTQTGSRWDGCFDLINKTIGPPDYFTLIPIANCSA
jgi:hypothetical protein